MRSGAGGAELGGLATHSLGAHPDSDAARLYEAHSRRVFATCLHLLGDREDAADATQEIFARALPVLDEVRHPSAWLQTAARHHCLDVLRRRRTAERLDMPAWAAGTHEPDPADVVVGRQQVVDTMAALPERERRALAHVALGDATVGELATRMRLSYAAAVQLVSRARRRAVQVGQLPATLAAPRLPRLTRLLRRLSAHLANAPISTPRGAAAGGALALCASLLCTAGVPAPPHSSRATVPSPSSPPVAPSTVRVPALAVHVPLPTGGAASRVALRAAPRVAMPAADQAPPLAEATTVMWRHGTPTNAAGPAAPPAAMLAATPSAGPQNQLAEGTMSVVGCGSSSVLAIRIHVEDMSLTLAPGTNGLEWAAAWTVPGGPTSVTGSAAAMWDGQTMSYSDVVGGAGSQTDSGRVVPGPGGYVEIDVPLSHLGTAQGGALQNVSGESYVQEREIWWGVDSAAGSQSYTATARC
jgi:RNA polymerase sigma factor (sigma-70 family)